jgi:hypothetical protein
MGLETNGKNALVDELASLVGFISLHTAQPNASGSNEVTGGLPAYARKACVWAAVGGTPGERQLNANLDFDVPATTVAYIGHWSAVSGGTFYGWSQVTAEVFAAQGIYRLLASATKLDIN